MTEPESLGEDFERWLDRQRFDDVERLFDGGQWSPKVGLKYSAVRDWLQRQRQLRSSARESEISRLAARADSRAMIALLIAAMSMAITLIDKIVSMWPYLYK